MMIRLLFAILLFSSCNVQAQRKSKDKEQPASATLDSIAFHLYTDSLKKGVHNYINVDGHYTDGRWLPLTSKELKFSCDGGKFEGNSLLLDKDFKGDKVTVTVTHNTNNALTRTMIIYIKQKGDDEKLKTKEEILDEIRNPGAKPRKKNKGFLG